MIATLVVAAFASVHVTNCYADGEEDPFCLFIGEGSYDGPLIRCAPAGATPIWGEFDASIPAILLHFQADMSSVSLKVVNLETGEQFCTVIRGKKGMVVPVFVSSGEGVYQVTFIPGNSGIQADSRTVEK